MTPLKQLFNVLGCAPLCSATAAVSAIPHRMHLMLLCKHVNTGKVLGVNTIMPAALQTSKSCIACVMTGHAYMLPHTQHKRYINGALSKVAVACQQLFGMPMETAEYRMVCVALVM